MEHNDLIRGDGDTRGHGVGVSMGWPHFFKVHQKPVRSTFAETVKLSMFIDWPRSWRTGKKLQSRAEGAHYRWQQNCEQNCEQNMCQDWQQGWDQGWHQNWHQDWYCQNWYCYYLPRRV